MKQCVAITVSGKVQEVGYRAYVQKHAQNLEIEGIVQNAEEKNKVIIKACGQADKLDKFIDLLYKGTPASRIDDIQVEPLLQEKSFREVFRIIGD